MIGRAAPWRVGAACLVPAGLALAVLSSRARGDDAPASLGPVTAAPSVLPATGAGNAPTVRVGDLGDVLTRLGGAGPQSGRSWTLTPSLGVSEEYTTGSTGTDSGVGPDQVVTTLTPTFALHGETTRLSGDALYAPQVMLYSRDGDQNQVAQNFNARLLATLVPQTLFLDLRGSGAVQAISGGQGPSGTTTLSRANTSQSLTFSAAPYAVHRFGPWGDGEIGAVVARTTQNALQSTGASPSTTSLESSASAQNATSYGGHLAFVTGEAFWRTNATALLQATRFDGSGVLLGAYRDTATLDAGYGLTRGITALGTLGWERIHYAGSSPVRIDDGVWNVGLRLSPRPDSTITARYGHQDGLDSLSLDAAWQITDRIRLLGRYSTGLTTQAEQLQNALATSDLDALGQPVDHLTGAPLAPADNFFGVQNSLFRTTLATVTALLTRDRDVFSVAVNSEQQTLVSAGNAAGLANGSTSGLYGSVSWSREMTPTLRGNLYGQYGTRQSGGAGSQTQQLSVISVSLSKTLGPSVSAEMQYSYTVVSGGSGTAADTAQAGGAQSLFLLSLTKSF